MGNHNCKIDAILAFVPETAILTTVARHDHPTSVTNGATGAP
jgi:hypothetical protein